MPASFQRRSAVSLAGLFLLGWAAAPVLAISPVVIMVYGAPLQHPVFITERRFFHDIENPTTITVNDMGERPYLKLAMFWGPQYERHVSDRNLLLQLQPEQAGQHGRLYLPSKTLPAVVLQTAVRSAAVVQAAPFPTDDRLLTWGGTLNAADLDFLRQSGVPLDDYSEPAK